MYYERGDMQCSWICYLKISGTNTAYRSHVRLRLLLFIGTHIAVWSYIEHLIDYSLILWWLSDNISIQ